MAYLINEECETEGYVKSFLSEYGISVKRGLGTTVRLIFPDGKFLSIAARGSIKVGEQNIGCHATVTASAYNADESIIPRQEVQQNGRTDGD